MDDLAKTGMHMSERSMMMMGSKLKIEHLPSPEKGVGAIFRRSGKMMGLPIDFTETVTLWKENKEKVWETIGLPEMIILGCYRMRLPTEPVASDKNESILFISLFIDIRLVYAFFLQKLTKKN